VNRDARFQRVTVTGYTDSQGAHAHNVRLSAARARAVATYLRAARFTTVGKGAAELVASNAMVEGRAQNRRVEIEPETA
jgi:outer membrane protein OmpA-like peptidoglycan-associated protein